ncbi:MAG: hypothetical protein JW967_10265 [Dehalococcoidales bacterium]|nr:hypothetical protein [Dehalococcoidales bacterium]
MKFSKLFRGKKHRKYSIKRDLEGKSLRARCFARFEQGQRPVDVAEELKMPMSTACRYFRDWQRIGPNFERRYAYVKSLFNKKAPDRDSNIELFAKVCQISKEQFETILSQPHGLQRLMTGKYYFPGHADVDHNKAIAFKLALLITDHLIKDGGKFEDIYLALKRYMQEYRINREEEDADTAEDNKVMAFFHKVLEIEMENERRGRIKPDTLSAEERDAAIKIGIALQMKKTQTKYWISIGILQAAGLTEAQAREKIYQDILNSGNLEMARMIREFQDKFHPLKTDSPQSQI